MTTKKPHESSKLDVQVGEFEVLVRRALVLVSFHGNMKNIEGRVAEKRHKSPRKADTPESKQP